MAMVCVVVGALCGYAVADAKDLAPGIITFQPPEGLAQPYPAVQASPAPDTSPVPDADFARAPAVDSSKVQRILERAAAQLDGKGALAAQVLDAQTGAELGAVNPSENLVPASNMKLLTAFAALRSLGAEKTFSTSVMREGEDLYLVGGGDIALAPDAGDSTATLGRAGLGDLARAVAQKLADVDAVQVFVDTSAYSDPLYEPSLPADSRSWVMPMSPLAMHLGKVSDDAPDGLASSYVDDPAAAALSAFVEQLNKAGVEASAAGHKTAPAEAEPVADVTSAPVRALADYLLLVSENSLAETLAHQVGIARGEDGSFAGGAAGVSKVLQEAGFDLSGSALHDGSGLSELNNISPALLTQVLRSVWACAADSRDAAHSDAQAWREAVKADGAESLRNAEGVTGCPTAAIGIGIPIGGVDGSLRSRFVDGAGTARVHAKTGSLDDASSLAGFVLTREGRPLIFAIVVNTEPGVDAYAQRPVIDAAVTALAEL